jgi:maleylpyruvate isomerase
MGGGPVTGETDGVPGDALRLLALATERVLQTVASGLDSDAAARAPSALPGWTRGHVATHLARNGDSFTWMLDGAAAGEVRDQYPGGRPTRAAAIEAGAGRPADELVADVERSATGLAAAFERTPPGAWARAVRTMAGEVPAWRLAWSRLREVEVHHADLGLGYGAADWLPDYVAGELDRMAAGVARRLPAGTALRLAATDTGAVWEVGAGPASLAVSGPAPWLLAWLLGRDVPAGALSAPAGFPPLGAW